MTSAAFFGTVAFAAGTGVTTFFAPCAFPLLPGYVGYYVRRNDDTPGLVSGLAAAAGAIVALGVIASLAFALGQRLTSLLPLFEPLIGAMLVVFGLLVLSGWTPPTIPLPKRPESLLGFGVFGAVYAVAAAGCVVPLFLGVIAQASALSPARGLVVLGAYAGGVAVPLVGVTLLTDAGVTAWRGAGRYAGYLKQAAGVLLVLAGLGQLYLSIVVLDVL
ncbi:cytochrome C biogenesis protein [Halobellus sp. Atlit-38R]|uniref:cytochrome c biogenesis CcdA family protein n=1 Tax=Halobellus sp. Atlit-38R TaxID=2282131 RepID=UPI000EF1D8C8|nr:cytochrome c biogenesis protein CcdA [Halobellus sp. Atlit-38R]RLM88630.1 cytochrome C biogenesis protein [Halobellus sp. Atlit-38R]